MKKKITIFIEAVTYIIFAVLYSSKGFALQLAKETSKVHAVYNKYGKSYSYLYFNPISEILYKVSVIGIILISVILIIHATYITYKELDYFKVGENIQMRFSDRVKKYIVIVLIALVYALILYSIPRVLQSSFFPEVGTEGVYFELF